MRKCFLSLWIYFFSVLLLFLIPLAQYGQKMDSLWGIWNNNEHSALDRMGAMKEIAWNATLRINPDSGAVLATELLNLAKNSNDLLYQAIALKTIGLSKYLKRDYQQALEMYTEALQYAKESKSQIEVANIFNNIGVANKALGEFESALEAHFKSLEIKEELQDKRGMALSYNNIGVLYSTQQNFPKAIEYFQKNLKILEELKMTKRMARTSYNIGLVHIEQKNYQEALPFFLNCEATFKSINNQRGLCQLYNSLGIIYYSNHHHDSAKIYYDKALTIATKLNDKTLKGNVFRNLGNLYHFQGNIDKAMDYYRRNYDIMTETGEKKRVIAAQIDIGALYLEMELPEKSKMWCERAYNQAVEHDYLQEIMSSSKYLYKSYEKLGFINKAYEFQEEYYSTRDSLDKLNNEEEVTRLVMQYQFEKQLLEDSLAMVAERKESELIYQSTLQKEKNRRNTILIIGVAILIVAGVLYGWLIFVQRNNKRLEEKNKIIEREKNRAEESERAKEQFFSNVSHEFRTPLTLILGPLDNLIARVKSEDLKIDLGIMKRNANRLYSMINELLNLYKIDSGKIKLNAKEVDFKDFLKRQLQSFEHMGALKGIRLIFVSESEDCYAFIDEEKMVKIINNLLSNAFKFTDRGGEIKIILSNEADINKEINVTVVDTGIGIPEDKIKHVFDRFYQVDDADKRGYEGTGIGLALTKELVELHRGKIWVESKLGEGSAFSFCIPKGKEHLTNEELFIADEDEDDIFEVEQNEISDLQEIINPEIKNPTLQRNLPILLIVEDNSDMRSYIKGCFDVDLYRVIEAKDGERGMKMAVEKVPDLIISDVMMPKMDGNEMCLKVKTDERTSHIPVVLVTARSSVEHKIKGIEGGADAYISKPFNAKELRVWVKKLIEQRKALRESFMRRFKHGIELATEDIPNVDQQFIQKALGVVDENISDPDFSVEKFGREMAMSRVQLHRKLKAITDQSASQFVRTIRLKKAGEFLKTRQTNIKETAYKYGFNNLSYFDRCFNKEFGMTPSEFISKRES